MFAPAGEFLFVRDKKEPKSASADGCPAELASFLRHSAQTAAGKMKDFHEVGRDACARVTLAWHFLLQHKVFILENIC